MIDLTGQRFGRLTVVEYAGPHLLPTGRKRRTYRVRCDCGSADKIVPGLVLANGATKSCGCYRAERLPSLNLRHGEAAEHARSAEYKTWCGMVARCENPKNKFFKDYGGRGIRICPQWRQSYATFLADILAEIGRRPTPQHSIDRYPDNDGDYQPGNVRWATPIEQRCNQRRVKEK